ncbi:MAG TPA: zf-HC2 domain-containing protein [Streptosporangiaceae bacterium]|jgi:hypothetical protein
MNGMTSCPEFRQLIGVYVVGAIDPHERALVDAHLPGCSGCREELASLAGLPALLGRVPADEAARISGIFSERSQPEQQPEILGPLLSRAHHQRRVQRWRGLAAVAAVVALVAGLSVGLTSALSYQSPSTAVHWENVHGTNSSTQVTAAIKYAKMPWGSRIDAQVSGVPGGTTCQLWVIGTGGTWQPAGSWTASWSKQGEHTWYQGSTSISAPQVHGFEITAGHKVLVYIPAT